MQNEIAQYCDMNRFIITYISYTATVAADWLNSSLEFGEHLNFSQQFSWTHFGNVRLQNHYVFK